MIIFFSKVEFLFHSKEQMCNELAYEWTQDLTNHLKRFAMPIHDPEPLDTIDILDEDLEVTKYEEGQLHNLGQFLALEPKVDKLNETLAINVTLLVRLLRTTYHWQRFFSNGILSMYHTCGQALPMAIFDVSTFRHYRSTQSKLFQCWTWCCPITPDRRSCT